MIIIGIDPGIARLGWGVVTEIKGKVKHVDCGCFETKAGDEAGKRLLEINHFLVKLFKKHQPNAIAVEEIYFAANARSAIMVGQARGAILLSVAQCKFPVFSYTPLQVKQVITGFGHAKKKEVQKRVKKILNLRKLVKQDDTADALAIAITHIYHYKPKLRKIKNSSSLKKFS